MLHHVARAVPDRLLFTRTTDAQRLFALIATTFPELVALCVMPDHFHLILPHSDPRNRLHDVLAGYAHGLFQRRGLSGPLFRARSPPTAIADDKHVRRTIRYVHMNPCRARIVADPLAWPFSTHRDRVGFAARPVVEAYPSPDAYHRYVSADSTVGTHGTLLPNPATPPIGAERLAEAVASVWRVTVDELMRRHPARTAFVRAATRLELAPADIRAVTGLCETQRYRIAKTVQAPDAYLRDPVLDACVRAASDSRFQALSDDDLRRERRFGRYASRR
jgi:REP element-mobilizing transposase RayT